MASVRACCAVLLPLAPLSNAKQPKAQPGAMVSATIRNTPA